MKILVAADGSPFSKRMLAYIAAHDEWLGAQHAYTVMTVVPAVPPRAAAVLDRTTLKSYYDDSAEKTFKPMRAFFAQQGLKAQFVAKVGPVAETLVSTADKGRFDLLMLGSHGHGSLLNLLLGSVATKVLAHSKTPVLLVR